MVTATAPVPQEMHAENTPELEYTVDDECYWICSGGGSQKIKLYKDDIAFEQTCPAPVLGVCCFPCGTVPIDVACFLSCCTGCFLPFGISVCKSHSAGVHTFGVCGAERWSPARPTASSRTFS